MNFADCLKKYMTEIPCTASELSAVSGLAPSMISRYLRLEQTPGDKALKKLASGLDFLSRDKGGPSLDHIMVYQLFQETLSGLTIDYSLFIKNLSTLLSELNVNNKELAVSLNFDPSYISRILSGSRHPANLTAFLDNVSDYLANRFLGTPYVPVIQNLAESTEESPDSVEKLAEIIKQYLGSHSETSLTLIQSLISQFNDFDTPGYDRQSRKSIYFSKTLPALRSVRRDYLGISGMTESFRDFVRCSINNTGKEDIIIYSDLPPIDSEEFREYYAACAEGISVLERSGRSIKIILDVHKPINELIRDIQNILPSLISGNITLYYLKEPTAKPFLHFIYSSGAAAVSGESFIGSEGDIRCTLYNSIYDSDYSRRRAEAVLEMAKPLLIAGKKGSLAIEEAIRNRCREDDVFHLFPSNNRAMLHKQELAGKTNNRLVIHRENNPLFSNTDIVLCPSKFSMITLNRAPYTSLLCLYPKLFSPMEALI